MTEAGTQTPIRVAAFVDGFNLYHSVKDLGRNHLKWLDLQKLCEAFAPPTQFQTKVYYFSAFATWLPDAVRRHQAYVDALRATGVTPTMGRFKEKDRRFKGPLQSTHQPDPAERRVFIDARWKSHEEKETDVNIALFLLLGAVKDQYDRALLISADSDLAPAVRMVCREAPQKEIRILTPPGHAGSMDLIRAAGAPKRSRRIRIVHLEHSLLPEQVLGTGGEVASLRPMEYAPPTP
jgi:uncharacterized LabA/DUF88 family protein